MDFKSILDLYKSVWDSYSNNVWTTIGLFAVGLGWVITGKESRIYLQSNRKVRVVLTIVIVTILVIHLNVLTGAYRQSDRLRQSIVTAVNTDDKLNENKNLEIGKNSLFVKQNITTIIDTYKIERYYPYVSFSLSALLGLGSIFIMWSKESKN
jgi:hypothetical protein